jgi:hypothetical protein
MFPIISKTFGKNKHTLFGNLAAMSIMGTIFWDMMLGSLAEVAYRINCKQETVNLVTGYILFKYIFEYVTSNGTILLMTGCEEIERRQRYSSTHSLPRRLEVGDW